LPVPNLIEIR